MEIQDLTVNDSKLKVIEQQQIQWNILELETKYFNNFF